MDARVKHGHDKQVWDQASGPGHWNVMSTAEQSAMSQPADPVADEPPLYADRVKVYPQKVEIGRASCRERV